MAGAALHTCGFCGMQFPVEDSVLFMDHLQQPHQQQQAAPLPVNVFQQQVHIAGNVALRPHQRATHAQLEGFFGNRNIMSVLVCACTGSGKTGTIAMAPLAVPGCKRVLVVCPSDTTKRVLLRALDAHQANFGARAFLRDKAVFVVPVCGQPFYPRVAVLQSQPGNALQPQQIVEVIRDHDITITTPAFLAYGGAGVYPRLNVLRDHRVVGNEPLIDLIIFDEAHHTPAATWVNIKNFIAKPGHTKILHTTATPFRTDAQLIDRDEDTPTFSMIDGLCMDEPCVKDACFLEIQSTTRGVLDAAGLLEEDRLASELGGRYYLPDDDVLLTFNAIARQLGVMRASGVPHKGLVVVNQVPGGIDRAEAVVNLLQHRQVRILEADGTTRRLEVAAYHCRLPAPYREALLRRFHKRCGRDLIDVLVTVDTLGEGYDFPFLSVVGILRPYMSHPPFYQFFGRATRRITHHVIGEDDVELTRMDNVAHIITHQRLNQRRWFEMLCHYMRANRQEDGVHDADYDAELLNAPVDAAGGAGQLGAALAAPAPQDVLGQKGPSGEPMRVQHNVLRMVLAPPTARGGEVYRANLVGELSIRHEGWNTRIEATRGVQWKFNDYEQDLTEL